MNKPVAAHRRRRTVASARRAGSASSPPERRAPSRCAIARASRSSRCTRRATGRARPTPTASASPASSPTRAASTPRCTAGAAGRSASSSAWACPRTTTARVKEMLALGASALSLIPCNSVFRGYDADEVPAELLGTCGTVINHVGDMDRALDGVPIGDLSHRHERPDAVHAAGLRAGGGASGAACPGRASPAPRTRATASRTSSPTTCSSASRCRARGASWSTTSPSPTSRCRAGTRCPSSASTCSRPAPRRPRRWPSRCARRIQYAEDCIAARHGPRPLPAALHLLLRHLGQPVRGGGQVPRRPPHLGQAVPRTLRRARTRARGASSSTARPRAWT